MYLDILQINIDKLEQSVI